VDAFFYTFMDILEPTEAAARVESTCTQLLLTDINILKMLQKQLVQLARDVNTWGTTKQIIGQFIVKVRAGRGQQTGWVCVGTPSGKGGWQVRKGASKRR
jgi:hypothetical protein